MDLIGIIALVFALNFIVPILIWILAGIFIAAGAISKRINKGE